MYKLKDLPRSDKPRERLADLGAGVLSDSELLSIVLSSGGKENNVLSLSRNLLHTFNSLEGTFAASYEELLKIKSIGTAKASLLKAVCEISRRLHTNTRPDLEIITSPQQVFDFTKRFFFRKKREEVVVVILDARGRAVSSELISVGTLSTAIIDPRTVFTCAIRKDAASIILVHNHPSGDPAPSSEDVKVTNQLFKAGEMLGICLVDHVVVTDREFTSLKALGLLQTKGRG